MQGSEKWLHRKVKKSAIFLIPGHNRLIIRRMKTKLLTKNAFADAKGRDRTFHNPSMPSVHTEEIPYRDIGYRRLLVGLKNQGKKLSPQLFAFGDYRHSLKQWVIRIRQSSVCKYI